MSGVRASHGGKIGTTIKSYTRRTSLSMGKESKDAAKPKRRTSYTTGHGSVLDKDMRTEKGRLYVHGPNLSDAELQRAKTVFFDVDRDGSGTIDREEVRSESFTRTLPATPLTHHIGHRACSRRFSCSRCCSRSEFSPPTRRWTR
jgi:hypothetical protein